MKRIWFWAILMITVGLTVSSCAQEKQEAENRAPEATSQAVQPAEQEAAPSAVEPAAPASETAKAVEAATASVAADKVVALVNGTPISEADLQRAVDQAVRLRQYQEHTTGASQIPTDAAEIRAGALDGLVYLELVYQSGKKADLVATADIDASIAALKTDLPDDAAYQAKLQGLKMTEPELRQKIERKLMIEKVFEQEVVAKAAMDEAEARKQYEAAPERFMAPESITVDALFVPIRIGARQQAEALAIELREKKNVETLADTEGVRVTRKATVSQEMDTKLFDVIKDLKVGDVSDVIIIDKSGMHVLQILEKKPAALMPFEQVRSWIEERARLERSKAFEQELKDAATVVIMDTDKAVDKTAAPVAAE